MLEKGTLVKKTHYAFDRAEFWGRPEVQDVGCVLQYDNFLVDKYGNRSCVRIEWSNGDIITVGERQVQPLTDKELFRYKLGLPIGE